MAKEYLDKTGLTYFWGKLKDYFQPKLVSGTNIKTINNTSLLGSGNISTTYSTATTSANGLMSSADKTKLDAIGTVQTANAAAKSVATATNTNLASISLSAGTWVITAGVRFPSNANGYRRMNINKTSASGAADVQLPAVNGASTQLNYTLIVTNTATTTWYLNCYHNAGTSLSLVAGGSENGINFIKAIRIA